MHERLELAEKSGVSVIVSRKALVVLVKYLIIRGWKCIGGVVGSAHVGSLNKWPGLLHVYIR